MNYISTRGNHSKEYSAAEAIREGMVPGGGLFVFKEVPKISLDKINTMKGMNYQELSVEILSKYLKDYTTKEIKECVEEAYNNINFTDKELSPLVELGDNISVLELWHGPTAAFKDMALQLMPKLFVKAREKTGATNENLILVATSGDTGKAALEGFKDLDGIKVAVFYPKDGVSRIQELQMVTTQGKNLKVFAVEGNFDDCQNEVKKIFSDDKFQEYLKNKEIELSSANSINLGRLLPQIIYYFKGYLQLLKEEKITCGEEVDFSVPTGNFGNILAGYYAKEMGLPIGKLICASNKNNVLTDFINKGIYSKNRPFYKTMSPSMDILVSSNLERFLYSQNKNSNMVKDLYESFEDTGTFEVDESTKLKIKSVMSADECSEDECMETIRNTFEKYDYLMDTHTAVAMKAALNKKSKNKMIVLSTASVYKFPKSVLKAIGRKGEDEFQELEVLESVYNKKLHKAVVDLDKKEIIHRRSFQFDEMKEVIRSFI